MEKSDLVKLSSYDKKSEAEFVKSVLLENGIESVLKGEDLYGISESNIGSYNLYVLNDDLKAAQMVIESITDPSAEINLPEKEVVEKDPQSIVHGTASLLFCHSICVDRKSDIEIRSNCKNRQESLKSKDF